VQRNDVVELMALLAGLAGHGAEIDGHAVGKRLHSVVTGVDYLLVAEPVDGVDVGLADR